MEIIKKSVDENITILEVGSDYDEESKSLTGQVELDIESQAYFVDMINTILEEGIVKIIVNMELVSYIDSSGLWSLFEGHKKAEQKNGKLVLLNPARDVKRVLDITKMSSKIQIFNDESEAVDSLK
ncbi:MAG: STAS domain-containing protein [bacterium]|nr:STAS domain-containing protein [bacterium]